MYTPDEILGHRGVRKTETDYQNYLLATTREISGKITIGEGYGLADSSRHIYGATWFATDGGKLNLSPKDSVLSFYYDEKNRHTQVDLNATLKTLLEYTQVSNDTYTDKPVTITINGKSMQLPYYSYLTPENLKESLLGGIEIPNGEYTFFEKDDYDQLGLMNLVGQTVDIKISW